MGQDAPDLAQAMARLRAVEDRDAVRDLLHRICTTIDASLADDWLNCFVADGRFSWNRDGDPTLLLDLNGRRALADWFTHHRASNPVGSQTHIVLHPVVIVRGDRAEASSSYMTLKKMGGEVVVASAGRYADVATRCPDGGWRIVSRSATGSMMRDAPAAEN